MTVQLYEKKGEITVFLSLILSVTIGLLCVIFESTRAQTIKFQTEVAMDAALRSCFGEYCKELYENYDLLYIDTSYRVGNSEMENLENHLCGYMDENLDFENKNNSTDLYKIDILDSSAEEYLFASDHDGIPAYLQATNYLEKYGDTRHISRINAINTQLTKTDADSLYAGWDESLSIVDSFGVEFLNPSAVVRSLCEAAPNQLISIRGKGMAKLPYGNVPSHRNLKRGSYENVQYREKETVFAEYLIQKCGSFVHPKNNTELLAEQEYILYGFDNDRKNVELVIERLIRIFAANAYETLGSCEEEMRIYAEMIVPPPRAIDDPRGWFDREALVMAVASSLRYAWAQGEGILKVDRLLGGGGVNAPNSSAEWILPLMEIMEYRSKMGGGGGSGYTYEEYLSAFILRKERKSVRLRFLDLIEINMRKVGCTGFAVDGCVEYLQEKVDVDSFFGYRYNITRDYAYEKIYREKNI